MYLTEKLGYKEYSGHILDSKVINFLPILVRLGASRNSEAQLGVCSSKENLRLGKIGVFFFSPVKFRVLLTGFQRSAPSLCPGKSPLIASHQSLGSTAICFPNLAKLSNGYSRKFQVLSSLLSCPSFSRAANLGRWNGGGGGGKF